MKFCKYCKTYKNCKFYRLKCKDCKNEYDLKKYREKNPIKSKLVCINEDCNGTDFYKNHRQCKTCINKKQKERYENNKEEILKRRAINRKENIIQNREYNNKYYYNNKEKRLEEQKIYYENNKEKRIEYINGWVENNKEKVKEYKNKYQKKYYSQLPKCIKCKFNTANPKFDEHCYHCFCYYHPNDERIKRKYLFKQHYIQENIINEFQEYLTSYDVKIQYGCSKRRPDWLFDMGIYSIVLECDEKQHSRNTKLCEEKREMEIFQDLGNRPIIFIRFNPDSYRNIKNNLIKSCFKFQNNILKVDKKEFEIRKYKLIETLKYWINYNKIPDKERTCVYLFYNKN